MRLIDTDKLTPTITQWNPSALIEERYYHEEQIINAPTVDAIPVEWLYEYLHTRYDYANATKYLGVEYFLYRVIDDWRKENE